MDPLPIRLAVCVHCRTGSLERKLLTLTQKHSVHCRTGSLENPFGVTKDVPHVHCRTGSLEMHERHRAARSQVHCRTGSLEMAEVRAQGVEMCALPYRQLSKIENKVSP